MDKLESPKSFSFEGNVSQGWKLCLKHFEIYFTATKKDRRMIKLSLSFIDLHRTKRQKIHETFSFDNPGDKIKLVPVLEKFCEYCNSRKNITILRHTFSTYLAMKDYFSKISEKLLPVL